MNKNKIVLLSPLIIIAVNIITGYLFGSLLAKWAFVPVILIEWALFLFFILKYSAAGAIKTWLQASSKNRGWNVVAVLIGLTPLPIFLQHKELLTDWQIFLPWILLALINPWLEEFYWRGLLCDHTASRNKWLSVFATAALFALNHLTFGINSTLMRNPAVLVSTFILGIVWAVTYKKTGSLRWVICAHFLVDFLNLSAPSFLDLYIPGR
ncbi:CPBP family intramembrane glutamic endopeptidase [Chitinophaga vietnamensis]|uniref:CPBP family intramembrane glutamic endopeptidase n=1 Tax=Chitinophaga vietnamensis TaxID=2593957 RepID=UPI001177A1B2|nr:CPBP family intramembrane glutamic endopeptidase [Chitinophaga vietnamensis]